MFFTQLLNKDHIVKSFDCGEPELNLFLTKYALMNQDSGSSRTYVALSDNQVIGFYTLTIGSIEHSSTSERLKKSLPAHPIPIFILARLAVASNKQNQKIGSGMLRDAMKKVLQVSESVGGRALIVHAKDQKAKEFYEHFDFQESPSDRLHLYLLIKDIKKRVTCTQPN
jgi:predicted N-acetyltransferase YhbS